MTTNVLTPNLDLLNQEYVLVQAWKKTASYIRYHNWYSDTLELDRTALNLPSFLTELSQKLLAADNWLSDPLRIVLAPKSQQWRVLQNTKDWKPVEKGKTAMKLRPLAHVSLMDQVTATAVMMCLADRVETLQGDPRSPIKDADNRKKVISYGNRLYCDSSEIGLHHRWGSVKLYRAYYQDYRTFLQRPELVAEIIRPDEDARVVVVHSDLSQFYDRVRPQLLSKKLENLKTHDDDPRFFSLVYRMFNWQWSTKDLNEVTDYAKKNNISNFSHVALPQGLVAAGFFANLVLLDFDEALRTMFSKKLPLDISVVDVCRYVDDLRIILKVNRTISLLEVEEIMAQWLQELLDTNANGLLLKDAKTKAALFRGDERSLVRQSRKMRRIQSAASGGFDAIGGIEILDAIQGLIRSQERYSKLRTDEQGWSFAPIPDVRDETVTRFAAGRYRSTYRSLRPLLSDIGERQDNEAWGNEEGVGSSRVSRTKSELDDDVRAFALGLIETWVNDPSNVRLLRIGLDLWPAEEILKNVLDLLRPFTEKGGRRKAPRRVAWYCLSEIFRAGAMETGFVEDYESMPADVDITAYRKTLWEEAARLASQTSSKLPWYLKQQILLFLATTNANQAPILRTGFNPETRHYRELIRFLKGEVNGLKGADFATLSILARRSFHGHDEAVHLVKRGITPHRLDQIAERDPSFALEILKLNEDLTGTVSPRIRNDLCLSPITGEEGLSSLCLVVLQLESKNLLRNEVSLLSFTSSFLESWSVQMPEVITPAEVWLKFKKNAGVTSEVDQVQIVPGRVAPTSSIYRVPSW
jgi:hypothetical protein